MDSNSSVEWLLSFGQSLNLKPSNSNFRVNSSKIGKSVGIIVDKSHALADILKDVLVQEELMTGEAKANV